MIPEACYSVPRPWNPSLAGLLPYLLTSVAVALLLVYVMVQWSRVAIYLPALRLPPAGDPQRAQGEDSASFAEIKAAWRSRAWQVSPRWRRLFAGLLGTAFLATGLFGLLVVIGPPGIKVSAKSSF